MKRFISPPFDQLDSLRTKLEPGEKKVFNFFYRYLSLDWEIYIQPHLNGLRPDILLLNPNVGIAVFEIKDWNLNALNYYIKLEDGNIPELCASKDGKHFSRQSENPIEKVFRYKAEIHELYCPRLEKKAGFALISAGVIFPYAEDKALEKLFELPRKFRKMNSNQDYYPLIGKNTLEKNQIDLVFPQSKRKYSKYMSEELAKDLRNWLIEPDFATTQRTALQLDEKQSRLVNSRTSSGYRRIKGPAGSGKSLVLAARASKLISENKKILVVTFNITLIHYLMDIAVRYPHGKANTRQDIIWLNFHSLLKRICISSGFEKQYRNIWKGLSEPTFGYENITLNEDDLGSVLRDELPALATHILINHKNSFTKNFDAVLVDEGQDFLPHWWDILRKLVIESGEMLLVADSTQDIYNTARSWTEEAMEGAGFRGEFVKLDVSYRMPPLLIELAKKFAENFLPKDLIDLPEAPQFELELYPCKLKWIQVRQELANEICKEEILKFAPSVDPVLLSIPDITFLSSNQKFGKIVSEKLTEYNFKTINTFGEDDYDTRRKKMGFFMGDARVKATTLHSFKGWESRAIIIYLGERFDTKSKFLAYTGMTRLKRHIEGSFLTIVSSIEELKDYGKTWPEFIEKS